MKFFAFVASAFVSFAHTAVAQNLIIDGGFDGAPQTAFGNQGPEELQPWYFGTVTPYNVIVNNHNLVSVDGSGGFSYSNLGPESDASGAGAGIPQYYIDSGSSGQLAWQYFTPSCSGEVTATALFTNREDHGRAEGTITGPEAPSTDVPGHFLQTEGGLSVFGVPSQIPTFAPGFTVASPALAQSVRDLNASHQAEEFRFVLGASPSQTSPWQPISHQVPVQAGQLYAFVAELGHSVNMDNASVVLECNDDDNTGTPGTTDTQVASIKTCDSLTLSANGSYQMNCAIDVTASGLAPGSFVIVADFFLGLPPVTASVSGTMMNVTSSEAWSCVDNQINAPSSIGVCELPAADMVAAGGQSTLNVSFDFTTDQPDGQVANCPLSQASDSSFVEADNKKSGFGGVNADAKSDGLPDGCVVLDLPVNVDEEKNPEKLERVRVRKKCAPPYAGSHNGAQGYVWECEIEADISPAPFNGTFTLIEDASNISAGQAEFMSASVPCNGIGTDMLSCAIDGNTMTSPYPVSVQIFTEIVSGLETVKWQNCASGRAETPAATMTSGLSCFETSFTPDDEVVVHTPPKEIAVEKTCTGEPFETEVNGVAGIGWDCDITVVANPAPFAGSFTFDEDASNISGTSNGVIVSMTPQNPAWNCASNLSAAQTSCEIAGSAFSPTGEETIAVQLFAPTGKEPIKWENCVSGKDTEAVEVKGNCASTAWSPNDDNEPPKLSLKKSCDGPTAFGDNQRYLCTIAVSNTGGPVSAPLTLEELFSNTAGTPATQYLLQLMGTTGWGCQSAPFSNGATCTISAADFNANTGHQISGMFLIPNGTLAEQDFQNCAALTVKGETVADAPCVEITEQNETTYDIEKSCKPVGERMVLAEDWVQAYECELTVTTNGVPFTDPIYVTDVMSYGQYSGNSLIGQLTSPDPWQCVQPPYAAPGQGNQPACAIQGADFPHSVGSSTITVTMSVHGAAVNQFGAENCGNVFTGFPTDGSEPQAAAQSCVTLFDPPEATDPTLSVAKTCEEAIFTSNNVWDVSCTVTISGSDLPAGQQIALSDELMSSGVNVAVSGAFEQGPFVGSNCGGGTIVGGVGTQCFITTDDITNSGGSISFPYAGKLNGPGGQALTNAAYPQNCTYATVPSIGLNAPGTGKVCVDIPLERDLVGTPFPDFANDGPAVLDEDAVANPDIGNPFVADDVVGNSAVLNPNVFTPGPEITTSKTCDPLVFAAGAATAQANCTITITSSSFQPGQIFSLNDGVSYTPSSAQNPPLVQGPITNLTGIPGLNCVHEVNSVNGIPAAICDGPALDTIGAGGTFTLNWTADIRRPFDGEPGFKNCMNIEYWVIPSVQAVSTPGACHTFEVSIAPKSDPTSDLTTIIPGNTAPPQTAVQDQIQDSLPTPTVLPQLALNTSSLGACAINRSSQTYNCPFNLEIRNQGNMPFVGPQVVMDDYGQGGLRTGDLIGEGWSFEPHDPVGVLALNGGLLLAPGQSTNIRTSVIVEGRRNGGEFSNCAYLGVPDDEEWATVLVQHIMNGRGIPVGAADGKRGPKTDRGLATLRNQLGLPASDQLDDGLFAALGLEKPVAGGQSCATVALPPMPASDVVEATPTPRPTGQCDPATTTRRGDRCVCTFSRMVQESATSCGCIRDHDFVAGEGCFAKTTPQILLDPPKPDTAQPALRCDPRTTRARGNRCVCLYDSMTKRNETSCTCPRGTEFQAGAGCLRIAEPDQPAKPKGTSLEDALKGEAAKRLKDLILKQ